MKWITVQEAAVIASVSKRITYSAIQNGQLRASRIAAGRNVRTTEQWVNEWLDPTAADGPALSKTA